MRRPDSLPASAPRTPAASVCALPPVLLDDPANFRAAYRSQPSSLEEAHPPQEACITRTARLSR